MFGRLRRSLRESFRSKSRRNGAHRSGADGSDAILSGAPGTSSATSGPPHVTTFPPNDATAATVKTTGSSATDSSVSKVPRQWQLDETAVRGGNCAFAVKYLGCAEVFESRGMHVCEQALALLRDNTVHRKPQRAILYVSGEGLRVVDSKSRNLLVDQTIEKVSFCSPDRNHSKGFAYICRDGTTRRWICHGFNAVADTGERLSHAVGCAFQECLQRKQTREKQLRTKQGSDQSANPGAAASTLTSTAIPNNSATVGFSTSSSNNTAHLALASFDAKPIVTGNQMNTNFQRGTHRTQSLADRRLDPQAFVKLDKPSAAPITTAAERRNDFVTVDSTEIPPQQFQRAQSSRVFSTQFVRQRLRSSIRSGAPSVSSSAGTQASSPLQTVIKETGGSMPTQNKEQKRYTSDNINGSGFVNAAINFASPTNDTQAPFADVTVGSQYGATTFYAESRNRTLNDSIISPASVQSSIQSEIMDLCSRINNQNFTGLPQTMQSDTSDAWNTTGSPSRYVHAAMIPPRTTVPGTLFASSHLNPNGARERDYGGNNNTIVLDSKLDSASLSAGKNVSHTHYYPANSKSSRLEPQRDEMLNATVAAVDAEQQQQRPNHLPVFVSNSKLNTNHQPPIDDEDPFSPPGWVDKSSAGPVFGGAAGGFQSSGIAGQNSINNTTLRNIEEERHSGENGAKSSPGYDAKFFPPDAAVAQQQRLSALASNAYERLVQNPANAYNNNNNSPTFPAEVYRNNHTQRQQEKPSYLTRSEVYSVRSQTPPRPTLSNGVISVPANTITHGSSSSSSAGQATNKFYTGVQQQQQQQPNFFAHHQQQSSNTDHADVDAARRQWEQQLPPTKPVGGVASEQQDPFNTTWVKLDAV